MSPSLSFKLRIHFASRIELVKIISVNIPPPPPPKFTKLRLHPSVHFNLNLLSAACKMLYSDSLKNPNLEPSQHPPPKRLWGEDVNLVLISYLVG